MEKLTRTEEKVYNAFVSFIREKSYTPTLQDVAKIVEIHANSVWRARRGLQKKGYMVQVNRNVYMPHEML